jgi:hypothetical protein
MHHLCLPHIQPLTGNWCVSKQELDGDSFLTGDG